ncbi:hypothetical protein BKA64DRAFT_666237 [Cadophora sp. MPI-SDFR-AT-0126]|nr:hypothetical protein BKA64DRAFT_666237 [Leotiomycetes sp. MPI-SDFR-AT-0126]
MINRLTIGVLGVGLAIFQASLLIHASPVAGSICTETFPAAATTSKANINTIPLLNPAPLSRSTAADVAYSLAKRKEGDLVCGPSPQDWQPAKKIGIHHGLTALFRGEELIWTPHGCTRMACFQDSSIWVCNDVLLGNSPRKISWAWEAYWQTTAIHCTEGNMVQARPKT